MTLTRDADSCTLPLPIGCSCVQDRSAISVECSGAQMTSVPKHWFGSGNLVVKTLNLERNNISEVSGHLSARLSYLLRQSPFTNSLKPSDIGNLYHALQLHVTVTTRLFARVTFE